METLFDELDGNTSEFEDIQIKKGPFNYPGGKSRSLQYILPHLPYTKRYIEVFGGSGIVLLARKPSKFEVFNDRYSGVIDFYRCLQDGKLFNQLCDRIDLSLNSKELFYEVDSDWVDVQDRVERAARWYLMVMYSFGSLGRNWGRATKSVSVLSTRISSRLKTFPMIHERIKNVQIDNTDWRQCIEDYDHPDSIFYLDPDYIDTSVGIYKYGMKRHDHENLLDLIFMSQGFFAISGSPNDLYDDPTWPWTNRYTWDVFNTIKSVTGTQANKKLDLDGLEKRQNQKEVLWIKEP